jgi:glycosyltransferase involved in cell wall biosynthesis
MCCHLPLKLSLGGAKVYIEAAEFYRLDGHHVKLVGIDEIVGNDKPFMDQGWRVQYFPQILKEFLIREGSEYDVIEFESIYLPYLMKDHLKSIIVARSILLDLHFKQITIPHFSGIRAIAGLLLKSWNRKKELNKRIDMSLQSMAYADFINVPNPSDKAILIKHGIDSDKIIVQPYGIFKDKFDQFNLIRANNLRTNKKKIIAFIGTFDNRKGAVEFPKIIKTILMTHPEVEFKLLGVLGMFPNAESIHHYIGDEFKNRVHIHGHYLPEELPQFLKDCSYGIFPSYLESFGFGVLEMMAMGLPVVGYDSPGINMLLLKELTVPAGNIKNLLIIFSKLINNDDFTKECIQKCLTRVEDFIYENQENLSIKNYQTKLLESRLN